MNPSKLEKLSGTWKLEFPHITINIVIKLGNVTLDGKTIVLKISKNKKYPFSHGWMNFQYGGFTYFIRISPDGPHSVRIDKHGKVFNGTFGKFSHTICVTS